MWVIKGIGGYLCSTDRLVVNQKRSAPASMDATALEFDTKSDAEDALTKALATFGNTPDHKFKVVEEKD
jgi:hypothetical protein